jgi:hypothetical protein
MSTTGKVKRKAGRPRGESPWATSLKFFISINYQDHKIAHTFAMLNQADLSDRVIQAIELLVESEKDQNLLNEEKRNAVVFSLINENKRPRKEKAAAKRQEPPQAAQVTPAIQMTSDEPKVAPAIAQTKPKAQYSDIVSDGGLDPRNAADLRNAAEVNLNTQPSTPPKTKAVIEFGAEQEITPEPEKSTSTVKSRFLQNHDY